MKQRRRVWGLFVALVVTALVLITIDFRDADDGPSAAAREAATSGVAPFERSLTFLVDPIRRLNVGRRDLLRTRSENQQLRAEVEELRERRRAYLDLERELDELRALLDVRDAGRYDVVGARVIAVSPSNFEWTMTIDVGSNDGVERGMAVINADGLVGRVLHTTATASRVLLTIDPNFSVAARTAADASVGVLDGRGADPMRFTPLDPRDGVTEGAELVTATFGGSPIPAGIPIGLVGPRDARSSRLSSVHDVRPFVDVARLDHVMVVLRGPAEVVPGFEDSDDIVVPRPQPLPQLTPPSDAPTEPPTEPQVGAGG
jgi:rod shape-determining protein MreC